MYISNVLPLAVVVLLASVNATPTLLQSYKSFTSIGCFNDSSHPLPQCSNNNDPPAARTLRHFVGSSSSMTTEFCLDQCLAGGYILAGLEFGKECYCGNALLYQPLQTSIFPCQMPCAGNSSEICGDSGRINVYQNANIPFTTGPAQIVPSYNDWTFLECFEDLPNFRHVPHELNIPPYSMTVELCLDGCQAATYNVGALQYGQECWCGNVTLPPGESVDRDCCNMACNDNAGEICGGSELNLVYFLPSAVDNGED